MRIFVAGIVLLIGVLVAGIAAYFTKTLTAESIWVCSTVMPTWASGLGKVIPIGVLLAAMYWSFRIAVGIDKRPPTQPPGSFLGRF